MVHPHLFRPGAIGTLRLSNRTVMGSMHLAMEGPGVDVERMVRFYVERARGGVGLVITGGVAVSPEGGGDHYACLTDPAHLSPYRRLAAAVRAEGVPVAMQLHHGGRYTSASFTGLQPVSASAVATRIFPGPPRALGVDEIEALIAAFGRGAAMARDLGYDAVEVMGSEGYLINQFLSPATNHRSDAWGGDLEGRMRFGLAVVESIRAAAGADFPLIFRVSGCDLVEGSTTWEETAEFARRLAQAGADALNLGIGWHEASIPTIGMMVPRAAFAFAARLLREAVGGAIPVIASNRINTPDVAEWVLSSGAADFVSLARPLLADPYFPAKAKAGEDGRINTCIACNQACLDNLFATPSRVVSCMVNPAAGREREFDLTRVRRPKRVAVVGGGPAGLEAARVLGERGHRVVLFERDEDLGGQLRLAVRVPGKGEFAETLRYYTVELRRLGVAVELRAGPSAADLASGFDAAVVATGVRPRVPDRTELPGVDLPHVVTYPDVFLGRVAIGERVAVIGAGGIACDLAHLLSEATLMPAEATAFLATHGILSPAETVGLRAGRRSVTLLRRGERVAPGVGPTTRWALLAALRRRGVNMLTGVSYLSIVPEGVRIARDGQEHLVEADSVVLACGQEPADDLARELQGRIACHVVGGARLTEKLDCRRAILEAAQAARAV
jgi:2,4-dienoyl-CoA reductase (NADPH2)